jgi:multiple sugar transport system permease protein
MVSATRRRPRPEVRNIPIGLLFALPWIVGFLGFVVYPMIASLYYSFTFYPILGHPQWSGLQNYRALFDDRLFKTATYNTAYFAALAVPTGILLALILALIMNRELVARPLYRTVFYLPTLMPGVSSAILWLWLLNSQYGLINMGLRAVGLPTISFLSSLTWSKPALVFMTWWGVGATMLIFLAALQDVPQSLYDAAAIDGAGSWHKIWHITLPMITPAIFFLFVTGMIGAFQTFTAVFFMTAGGPADSTLMYALYTYRVAFERMWMGYACALAWVLLLIVGSLTVVMFRLSGRWVFYAGGGAK